LSGQAPQIEALVPFGHPPKPAGIEAETMLDDPEVIGCPEADEVPFGRPTGSGDEWTVLPAQDAFEGLPQLEPPRLYGLVDLNT